MTIWRMRIACWITKAKSKPSGYVMLVCILLGISPASDCDLPTFRNLLSVPSSKAGCRVLSVILIAFPLHQLLQERISMLRYT
jgi:hypothetical protein